MLLSAKYSLGRRLYSLNALLLYSSCDCHIVDGIIGMAIVGGAAAVAAGAIVGLGVALSRKK